MTTKISESTQGVYAISPTPFTAEGELDLSSADTLIDFYRGHGVTGLTVLGILGEATKLTPQESRAFLERMLEKAGPQMPIIVGASNPGTDNLARFAKDAMAMGAAGIMIAPLGGLKTDDQIFAYVEAVVDKLGADIPLCYQDFPQTTGVVTSVSVLNRIIDAFPSVVMLKHEESPGLSKITQLRQRSDKGEGRRISILVGNGGMHLPQELRRGVDGAMTGFAFPEMLVEVTRRSLAGEFETAEDLFDLYLPILRHEQQLGVGLAVRKEILRRRGAIATAALRHPGPKMTPRDVQELDELMARLERKLAGRTA